jgi:hypothetical protein
MHKAERFPVVRDRVRFGMWLTIAGCFLAASLPMAGQVSREYDVKAALLFNFTRFVEWPATAFARADSPVVIGILGEDPFGSVLDEIVRNETCAGRAIRIERYRNVEAAAQNAQILFISASEKAEFPRILRVLRTRPILTVGELEDFDARGGMIRFVKNPAQKIHLRINLESFKTAGLVVSAKLLRLDETVSAPGN